MGDVDAGGGAGTDVEVDAGMGMMGMVVSSFGVNGDSVAGVGTPLGETVTVE